MRLQPAHPGSSGRKPASADPDDLTPRAPLNRHSRSVDLRAEPESKGASRRTVHHVSLNERDLGDSRRDGGCRSHHRLVGFGRSEGNRCGCLRQNRRHLRDGRSGRPVERQHQPGSRGCSQVEQGELCDIDAGSDDGERQPFDVGQVRAVRRRLVSQGVQVVGLAGRPRHQGVPVAMPTLGNTGIPSDEDLTGRNHRVLSSQLGRSERLVEARVETHTSLPPTAGGMEASPRFTQVLPTSRGRVHPAHLVQSPVELLPLGTDQPLRDAAPRGFTDLPFGNPVDLPTGNLPGRQQPGSCIGGG
nr:unknown [uncultured bacterium]